MFKEDKWINIESKVKGTTYKVFWYLLNCKTPVGVRRIQRDLNLSSPSVAAYHLDKLVNLEIVETDGRGQYYAIEGVRADILRSFVRLGRIKLPRYLFYAIFFSTIFLNYIWYCFFLQVQMDRVFALALGIVGTFILWYETIKVHFWKPF